jgi:hypothetical protein
MALADAVQGAKRPSQTIAWTDEDGVPVDLTGATITARIRGTAPVSAARSADGAFVVINAAAGQFRWDYGTADVATAGRYQVQFTAVFATGMTPARTIRMGWYVHEAI